MEASKLPASRGEGEPGLEPGILAPEFPLDNQVTASSSCMPTSANHLQMGEFGKKIK